MRLSLHRHDGLNDCPLHLIQGGAQGLGLKIPTVTTGLIPLATTAHPWVGSKSHSTNITSDLSDSQNLGNFKGFGNSVPEMGEDQLYNIINQNITGRDH